MAKLPGMTTLYNEAMDITIAVPVGWTGKLLHQHAFRIFGPQEAKYKDYRPTLSIEQMRMETDDSLEDLAKLALEELQSDMEGFQLLREEHFATKDGSPAFARWFEWRDPDGGQRYSQIQATVLTGDHRLYLIDAAMLKPLEAKYMPVFNHILKSVDIAG